MESHRLGKTKLLNVLAVIHVKKDVLSVFRLQSAWKKQQNYLVFKLTKGRPDCSEHPFLFLFPYPDFFYRTPSGIIFLSGYFFVCTYSYVISLFLFQLADFL